MMQTIAAHRKYSQMQVTAAVSTALATKTGETRILLDVDKKFWMKLIHSLPSQEGNS